MPDQDPVATFVPVTKDDITAFSAQLVTWGATLSTKDQQFFQLLLDRAKALQPEDVKREQFQAGISSAISTVYTALVHAWTDADPTSWVRVDPIWYKAGTGDAGESVQISATITKAP